MWCVWMRFVHKNGIGWGMIAHDLTQEQAEWMANTILQPARAMPMRDKPETKGAERHYNLAETTKYDSVYKKSS